MFLHLRYFNILNSSEISFQKSLYTWENYLQLPGHVFVIRMRTLQSDFSSVIECMLFLQRLLVPWHVQLKSQGPGIGKAELSWVNQCLDSRQGTFVCCMFINGHACGPFRSCSR